MARLPGLEDAQIEAIEDLATEYKKVQKRRMIALAKEDDESGDEE